jgi:hypothetical protein
MRRQDEDGPLIATIGGVSDAVLVARTKDDRGVGVNDDSLAAAFHEENASARKADLGDGVEHRRPVGRGGLVADDVVDAGNRAVEQEMCRLQFRHAQIEAVLSSRAWRSIDAAVVVRPQELRSEQAAEDAYEAAV